MQEAISAKTGGSHWGRNGMIDHRGPSTELREGEMMGEGDDLQYNASMEEMEVSSSVYVYTGRLLHTCRGRLTYFLSERVCTPCTMNEWSKSSKDEFD